MLDERQTEEIILDKNKEALPHAFYMTGSVEARMFSNLATTTFI